MCACVRVCVERVCVWCVCERVCERVCVCVRERERVERALVQHRQPQRRHLIALGGQGVFRGYFSVWGMFLVGVRSWG